MACAYLRAGLGEREACFHLPVMRDGVRVGSTGPSCSLRERALRELGSLHRSIVRLENPHPYPAGLTLSLHERRARMMQHPPGDR